MPTHRSLSSKARLALHQNWQFREIPETLFQVLNKLSTTEIYNLIWLNQEGFIQKMKVKFEVIEKELGDKYYTQLSKLEIIYI
jgi:hypothetical protein